MASVPPLSILHLSDLQFGPKHGFGKTGLIESITTDLALLAASHSLVPPDLIFLTGDLTERGRPSEFAECAEFIIALAERMRLPLSRVIIVPGNHDISRDECEGYFKTCAARETTPVPPFWPKWSQYDAFLKKLYGHDAFDLFSEEEPWALREFADLRVVVATLNSTMDESHRETDHHGFLGAAQIEWFAQRLEPYTRQRWMRLAALHHNVRRGPTRDDENLRDANQFQRKLGPLVNAVFHGHTHDGSFDWLSQQVPILSTGSAAVVKEARGEEIPNQYQVVLMERDAVHRWTRHYVKTEERWVGDTRGTHDGSNWKLRVPAPFEAVEATFPEQHSVTEPGMTIDIRRQSSPEDEFLAQVARVCELRERHGSEVKTVRRHLGREHLEVIVGDGDITTMFPVGASLTAPDEAMLENFVRRVHRRYAVNDSGVKSQFIYGGDEPADSELVARMRSQRVYVMSFVEYQGLIDFRGYVADQTDRLVRDAIYPPALYVPQRIRFSHGETDIVGEDALATLQGWLSEPAGRFIVVLGDFGAGKTFLLHELARHLATDSPGLTPVLVQLRDLEKGRTLEQLLAQHFAQTGGREELSLRKFRYMLEQGRIALLFDGFDELVVRVTYPRAADHFDTLLDAAAGNAKVVITSRTQHFISHEQVLTAIGRRVEALVGCRVATLQGFDDQQIREFLRRKFGDAAAAEARFQLLGQINDLIGLSQNPRMLSFIADLSDEQLSEARRSKSDITPAALYKLLLNRWLTQEFDRVNPRGAPPGLSVEDRWRAVTELALRLWRTTDRGVTVSEMTESTASVLNVLTKSSDLDPAVAAFQVGSGTLLVRDVDDQFSFIHQSVQEWLVASRIADEIATFGTSELLLERELTLLTVDFLFGLAPQNELLAWASEAIKSTSSDAAKKNALAVQKRGGVEPQADADFSGQDLRGTDFSKRNLSGALFVDANLAACRYVGSTLEGVKFERANLHQADFTDANLRNADLVGAKLTRTRFIKTDLRGARLDGANLTRAVLLGAQLSEEALDATATTFGAAVRIDQQLGVEYEGGREIFTVMDASPLASLLATASERAISIWDTETRQVIRRIEERGVTSVLFLGRSLFASTRSGTVRSWDVETGNEIGELKVSSAAVTCMAMGRSGHLLVTGGEDGIVRTWHREGTGWRRDDELRASAGYINSVALDPEQRLVAAASNDRLVHVWNVELGSHVASLAGHGNFVRSVVFGTKSTSIFSASSDAEVIHWLADGTHKFLPYDAIRLVADHTHRSIIMIGWRVAAYDLEYGTAGMFEISDAVSAAFRPDDRAVFVARNDGTVRLGDISRFTSMELLSTRHRFSTSVGVTYSGDTLATIVPGKEFRLWNMRSGQQWWREEFTSEHTTLGHVHGRLAVIGATGKMLTARDLGTGRELFSEAVESPTEFLAVGGAGTRLCVASASGAMHTFSLTTAELTASWNIDEPPVSICMSQDDEMVGVVTRRRVRLMRASTGGTVSSYDRVLGNVAAAGFAPDGGLCIAIESGLYIFDPDGPRFAEPLSTGAQFDRLVFAFHPHEPVLIAGRANGGVVLWNIEAGRRISRQRLHRDAISGIAVAPDGNHVAVAGADGAILYCVLQKQKRLTPLGTLLHLAEGWVTFTPDGSYKHGGVINRGFWHVIGLCRFEVGELAAIAPHLRVADYTPIFDHDIEQENEYDEQEDEA